MRKSINIILSLLFIVPSLTLLAQSAEEELEQAELIKQFNGTWEAKISDDITAFMEVVPIAGGNTFINEFKNSGETTYEVRGLLGLSQDGQTVVSHMIQQGGVIVSLYGRFVSESLLVREGFIDNAEYPVVMQEIEILSPESFSLRQKNRNADLTWSEWSEDTYQRVK